MSKRSSTAGYTPAVDVGPLCAALRQMLRGSARSLGQWRVRIFERKFGTDFLATVPREPGIYRMYDAAGGLFYVGKARNLRRRLAQYHTARRTKKDRKRRTLVRPADRIEWQVCASLFSDQSAWAHGRCRDTADRAGVPEIVPHGPLQGAIGRIATHPCARGRAVRTDERRYPFAAAGSRSENPVLSCLWLWLIVRLRLREVWPRKSSRSGTGPWHPA
jgi:hypothetical protein